MTRKVIEALLRARGHREARAMSLVAQNRSLLAKRLNELRAIHVRLAALRREGRQLAERLAGTIAAGTFDAAALAAIDDRRALLRDARAKTREELMIANVNRTSDARTGLPSCQCAPGCRRKTITLESRSQDQLSASAGRNPPSTRPSSPIHASGSKI